MLCAVLLYWPVPVAGAFVRMARVFFMFWGVSRLRVINLYGRDQFREPALSGPRGTQDTRALESTLVNTKSGEMRRRKLRDDTQPLAGPGKRFGNRHMRES